METGKKKKETGKKIIEQGKTKMEKGKKLKIEEERNRMGKNNCIGEENT